MNESLAAYGIDVPSIIAALIGCIVVQTLLPRRSGVDLAPIRVATVVLGSVLFASLTNPLAFAWVAHNHPDFIPTGGEPQVRAATAAVLGGFAQPLLEALLALGRRFLARQIKEG